MTVFDAPEELYGNDIWSMKVDLWVIDPEQSSWAWIIVIESLKKYKGANYVGVISQ